LAEVNFDGLVGPTHNYSGLSQGNIASTQHRSYVSNPKMAALQGLGKMKTLLDMGFVQGIIPPQERPDIHRLRALGFVGGDKKILEDVRKKFPELLMAVSSASSMWTANAATVSPSHDTKDRKVHFTPANLNSKFHRSIESATTAEILKKIFKNPKFFVHHPPVVGGPFGDEGAANHTRLCKAYEKKGLEFFVYGKSALTPGALPKIYDARQALEASQIIARNHLLRESETFFTQQAPLAIDAGIFHNDVAGVGNQNFYFCHELAYNNTRDVSLRLQKQFKECFKSELHFVIVSEKEVPLQDAVKSYLFNSQILTIDEDNMLLLLPKEAEENHTVAAYTKKLLDLETPIKQVRYIDLRQSMQNGGGPACLRLRVVLNVKELAAIHQKCLLTSRLYERLVVWVKKHYRDRLEFKDLGDPHLLNESRGALDELTQVLGLGSIYTFQK
jgi:succinylarginine dihydrolase